MHYLSKFYYDNIKIIISNVWGYINRLRAKELGLRLNPS